MLGLHNLARGVIADCELVILANCWSFLDQPARDLLAVGLADICAKDPDRRHIVIGGFDLIYLALAQMLDRFTPDGHPWSGDCAPDPAGT